MKTPSIISAAVLGLTLGLGTPVIMAQANLAVAAESAAPVAPRLQATLQNLWHGHIVATRDYALAVHADDTEAAKKAETETVDNAKQIAAAVGSIYGDDAEKGSLELLGGHWTGVKALTQAIKKNDEAAQSQAMKNLSQNAMEIAEYFSSANPDNWTVDALNQALLGHAGHHEHQIDLMMNDASADEQQEAWTQMQEHMDMIADVLAAGIAAQYPDKVN